MRPVKVEGVKELRETLKTVMPREARGIARRTVTRIARDVRDTIRDRIPAETGNLKKAIRSRRTRAPKDEASAGIFVTHGNEAKRDGWYWFFVEFGTTRQRAQHFITNSIAEWEQKIAAAYQRQWWIEFEKQMAKRGRK